MITTLLLSVVCLVNALLGTTASVLDSQKLQSAKPATVCTSEKECPSGCICSISSSSNVRVDCSSKTMTNLPRTLPLHTEIFLFNNNKLTSLPDDAFVGCTVLLHLDLSSNFLKNLSVNAFRGIDQLQTLLLNNNSIDFTTMSAATWQKLTKLSQLSIHDNSKSDLAVNYNDQLFAQLNSLQNLTMDGLSNATFGPGFSGLHSLEYLNMLGDFRYITNDTFQNLNKSPLKTFMVGSGVLTDVDVLSFSHFKQLQVLNISFNPLLGFPNMSRSWYGLQFTNISDLILERSAPYDYQIITIKRHFPKYLELTRLKKLVLDANNIITIDAVFSFHTRHLEYLSIAYNRLVQIMGFVLDMFFLPNLSTVDVSFQSRRLVTRDEWPTGNQLGMSLTHKRPRVLVVKPGEKRTGTADFPQLSWEQAQHYMPAIFTNVTLLEHLHNEGTLLVEGVGYISITMPIPAGPMYLLLPPRIRNFQAAAILTVDDDTFLETTVFGTNQLQTVNYSQNSLRNLIGPFIIKCPPPYKLTVDFSENNVERVDPNFTKQFGSFVGTMYLGQNNLGNQLASDDNGTTLKYLSELTTLDLSSNNIKSLPTYVFIHQVRLQHLDLSYNSLRLINFSVDHMEHLTFLDLSANLLDQLDLHTRISMDLAASKNNLTVDITENPLQCSCETLGFLEWVLQSKTHVTNWERYECMYNGKLMKLSYLKATMLPCLQVECHGETWVIGSAIVLVSVVVVLFVSCVLHRYRFEIRFLCLRLVVKRRYYQALEEQDQEYEFHAFVAFDKCDRHWINEHLIEQLDYQNGRGEFKLLVHHRDFLPGRPINENILDGMEKSRKIILVISKHFVDSSWCDFELQMAQMRCFDEGKELVIPILLEEELPPAKLSKSLRSLLNRNTYLQWPIDENERSNFWRNLKRSLASVPDRTIRCQCGQTMTV